MKFLQPHHDVEMDVGAQKCILDLCNLDCPLSKGNQAPYPKFERRNGKILKHILYQLKVPKQLT